MPEAKVRLKEFWIKGKRINSLKHKAAIRKQVESTIRREIKYISSFFPYSIEKFHNPSLLYFQSIFLMEDFQDDCFKKHLEESDRESPGIDDIDLDHKEINRKVMNLVVGLELLSIGTTFHDFKLSGSLLNSGENPGKVEKEYTLDLLFGDIFYSRAVIYLLRYEDHSVFDRILNSLKKLHESRLKIHMAIGDLLQTGSDHSEIGMDISYDSLIKANKLLDISLDISFEMFCENSGDEEKNIYSDIIRPIIAIKTYGELLKYILSIKTGFSTEKISAQLTSKKNFTALQLSDIISRLDSGKFKSSLKALLDSLDI